MHQSISNNSRHFETSGDNDLCIQRSSDTFGVVCKNANLCADDKLPLLLADLHNIVWDVVLFSESRRKSQDQILDGGHRLISHIGSYHASGVAILIHSRHVANISSVRPVSDRILFVDLTYDSCSVR